VREGYLGVPVCVAAERARAVEAEACSLARDRDLGPQSQRAVTGSLVLAAGAVQKSR
jgi:hypothetical protein